MTAAAAGVAVNVGGRDSLSESRPSTFYLQLFMRRCVYAAWGMDSRLRTITMPMTTSVTARTRSTGVTK